jgi:hypothetical protein
MKPTRTLLMQPPLHERNNDQPLPPPPRCSRAGTKLRANAAPSSMPPAAPRPAWAQIQPAQAGLCSRRSYGSPRPHSSRCTPAYPLHRSRRQLLAPPPCLHQHLPEAKMHPRKEKNTPPPPTLGRAQASPTRPSAAAMMQGWVGGGP